MVWAILLGIGVVLVLAAAAIIAFLRYRETKRELTLERVEKLFRDIEFTMEQRPIRNPELIQHKLDAAERYCANGEYEDAEETLEDVLRLVQLS